MAVDRYPHLAAAFYEHPWAIVPAKLQEIETILRARIAGGARGTPEAFEPAPKAGPGYQSYGKVAVLPVFGVLTQRAGLFDQVSGMSGTEQIGKVFDRLMADKAVKSIVLNVDSPGGSVYGTAELAAKVAAARGEKKVVSVANSLMASAAYWIGSSAAEVVVTPGGQVGSIGVVAMHQDCSRALDEMGMTVSYVYAGKYKVEGNPCQPLGEEARAAWQESVDAYYAKFVRAVARSRGVSESSVRSGYGQGRVLTAEAAKAAGLVDRVATLDNVLSQLGADASADNGTNAARQRLAEVE